MAFHQYNTDLYNTAQYNADVTAWYNLLSDAVTSTDVIAKFPSKSLADSETMTDGISKQPQPFMTDNMLFTEGFTKQVTNKGLTDTIRTESWFTGKRAPGNNPWGD